MTVCGTSAVTAARTSAWCAGCRDADGVERAVDAGRERSDTAGVEQAAGLNRVETSLADRSCIRASQAGEEERGERKAKGKKGKRRVAHGKTSLGVCPARALPPARRAAKMAQRPMAIIASISLC
jgi:hypothetical protein